MERWAAFPTWWVRDGLLRRLDAASATTGAHIAALKVYLAVAIVSDYVTRSAEISVTQLQVVTGLSRPMVTAGTAVLEKIEVLAVNRSGYRNTYSLLQASDQVHWMKIPVSAIRLRLKDLPNATASGLAAMKLLLVLLTTRQRRSHEAPISHRKLQKHTGVRPTMISKGISHLIAHGLVRHANKPAYTDAAGHPVNTYYLLGIFSEGKDSADDVAAGMPPSFEDDAEEDAQEPGAAFLHRVLA